MSSEVSFIPGEVLEAGNSHGGEDRVWQRRWASVGRAKGGGGEGRGRPWGVQVSNGDGKVHLRDLLEEGVAALCVASEGNRKPKMSLEFLVCMARRDLGLM